MGKYESIFLSFEDKKEIHDLPTADDRYEFMKNYLESNKESFDQLDDFMKCISKVEFKKLSFEEIIPHIMSIAMMEYPIAYNELIVSMKEYVGYYDDNQF